MKANNVALKVKQLIETQSNYPSRKHQPSLVVMKNLTVLSFSADIKPEFPPLNADLHENGDALNKWHNKVRKAASPYPESDVFVPCAGNPDQSGFIKIMRGGGDEFVEGAIQFSSDMIQAWLDSNIEFEEKRKLSCQIQMSNAGVDEETIAKLIADPAALRAFIAQQRRELIAHLARIMQKRDAKNVLDMPTQKELELLEKHSDWFPDQAREEDNYYPNDGAVEYAMLFVEIIYMLKTSGYDTPKRAWDAMKVFSAIIHNAMHSQSSRMAWQQLSQISDFVFDRVNICAVVRDYVTDNERNIKDQVKLASPFGRGPLRLARIFQTCMGKPGPFAVMTCPLESQMKDLITMRALEDEIIELAQTTKFIDSTVKDLRISFAVGWLLTVDRVSVFCSANGRNDLSVPKILGGITNIDTSAYEDLQPRPWSLIEDITGGKVRGRSILDPHDLDDDDVDLGGGASGNSGENDDADDDDTNGSSSNTDNTDSGSTDDDKQMTTSSSATTTTTKRFDEKMAVLRAVEAAKTAMGTPNMTEASILRFEANQVAKLATQQHVTESVESTSMHDRKGFLQNIAEDLKKRMTPAKSATTEAKSTDSVVPVAPNQPKKQSTSKSPRSPRKAKTGATQRQTDDQQLTVTSNKIATELSKMGVNSASLTADELTLLVNQVTAQVNDIDME